MRKRCLCALLATAGALSAFADGSQATITSTPSPVVATKPFEITIQTSDFGDEVYCYTWAKAGSDTKPATDWDVSIKNSYKMTGSGGNYTFRIDNLKEFYNLSDSQLAATTKLGFIARTASGSQTADCFVEVVQAAAEVYSGGDGTMSSPYLLSKPQDILDLAANPSDWVAGKYFNMTDDITVGAFSGIGNMENPFKGNFNGCGHVLKSATVTGNNSLGSATGVFNAIEGATIEALGVTDATISGTTYCGGLVGYAVSGTISRCFSSGTVRSTSICAGGLVGENHAATISDCYSIAEVINSEDYATGGLVGKNEGTIDRTYAAGKVTGYNYVGGLTGANYGNVNNSVTINSGITANADADYVARFGGNNNPQNTASNNYSWIAMPTSQSAWSEFGHQADSHNLSLTNKATYESTLGWNFNTVWEWRTEGTHSYPVLAGLAEQVDPGCDSFYSAITMVNAAITGDNTVSVYPNPVESTLNIEATSGISLLEFHSVSGMTVRKDACNGECTVSTGCDDLAAGIYILTVRLTDGTNVTKKIIKK